MRSANLSKLTSWVRGTTLSIFDICPALQVRGSGRCGDRAEQRQADRPLPAARPTRHENRDPGSLTTENYQRIGGNYYKTGEITTELGHTCKIEALLCKFHTPDIRG